MNSILAPIRQQFVSGDAFVNGDKAILEDGRVFICTIWCKLEKLEDVIGNPNFYEDK